MKLFRKNIRKDTSESEICISMDTKDFRFIAPKDYPDAEFGDISRESDAELVKKSNVDDRTPDYRDPLIDAYTDFSKTLIDEHFTNNNRMWQIIKLGAQAQMSRVESDLEFVKYVESTLNPDRRNIDEKLEGEKS